MLDRERQVRADAFAGRVKAEGRFMEMKLPRGRYCGQVIKSREVAGFTLTETVYAPGARLPKHSHENGYICFVRQGEYVETYGRKTRSCKALTLAFHPSGEIHSEAFQGQGARSFNIEIGPRWIERVREHSRILDSPSEFQGGALASLAMKIYREFYNRDEVSSIAIEGLTLEFIAEASRRATKSSAPAAPRWLEEAKELIHERFSENLSVTRIAETVGVHPVYLASVFRLHLHCTIGDYMRRLRVEFACREMSRSETPLVDIALAAGFAHQSHFSRIFKSVTGMTPSGYRAGARGE